MKVAVVVILCINVLFNIVVFNLFDNKLLVVILLKQSASLSEPPVCKSDIAEICEFTVLFNPVIKLELELIY